MNDTIILEVLAQFVRVSLDKMTQNNKHIYDTTVFLHFFYFFPPFSLSSPSFSLIFLSITAGNDIFMVSITPHFSSAINHQHRRRLRRPLSDICFSRLHTISLSITIEFSSETSRRRCSRYLSHLTSHRRPPLSPVPFSFSVVLFYTTKLFAGSIATTVT